MKKNKYNSESFCKRDLVFGFITEDPQLLIDNYLKKLRISEKYYNKYKQSSNIINKVFFAFLWILNKRKRNKLGNKINIDIRENSLGDYSMICHPNIVINGHAKLGEGCILHGNNCIGNNGITPECPTIGKNVDIGWGASVFGDVTIANNVKIGAGAVVVSSINEEGITVVGIPAKKK